MLRKVKVECSKFQYQKSIYLILPKIRVAMKEAGKEKQYHKLWNEVTHSRNYEQAQKVIRKYVKLIFTDNKKGGGLCQIGS